MIDYGYISEILGRFEGKGIARGYIPCEKGTWYGGEEPDKGEPMGASGVTIGTGIDLGQQSYYGLLNMGVLEETAKILEPYIGLQKQAAKDKLKEAPFQLTADQVAELDGKIKKVYIDGAARKFGLDLFIAAPKQVQAVACSLCYQFGTPYRDSSLSLGNAWEAMRNQKYKEAADCLSNPFGWSAAHQVYMARRKAEAALLMEAA